MSKFIKRGIKTRVHSGGRGEVSVGCDSPSVEIFKKHLGHLMRIWAFGCPALGFCDSIKIIFCPVGFIF